MDPVIQEFFKTELGAPEVRFVDGSRLPWPAHHRPLFLPGATYKQQGWAIKLAAAYLAPFKEILFLDGDSTPLVPPESLFDLPEYKRTGALFWPDKPPQRPPIFTELIKMGLIAEADAPEGLIRQTEAGEFLLDRRRHREPLEYIMFLGTRSDITFTMSYGDKELFYAGFALAGAAANYSLARREMGMAWGPVERYEKTEERATEADKGRALRGYVQFSPDDGRPLFMHRTGDSRILQTKYRLGMLGGKPVDVISGPLPRSWSYLMFNTRHSDPAWPVSDFLVVRPKVCPFSLDASFGDAAAQCSAGFDGEEGQALPVYRVAGSAMADVLAEQDVGWERLLAARKADPELFAVSMVGTLLEWWGALKNVG